jgi:hypothetical protein
MKKTIFFIAVAVLCLFFRGFGQSGGAGAVGAGALAVGDRVPDVRFDYVVDSGGRVMGLSDFKGRAVILDFWATWCGACLARMPHMMDMQRKFGRRLQVIAVNNSPSDGGGKLEAFLKAKKGTKYEIVVPVVYMQKELDVLFPHPYIPFYVWIGADGRLKAVTGPKEVTEENVQRLISGLKIYVPLKETGDGSF